MSRVDVEVLRGAVARGWCSPENASKEMDPALAEAIVREVEAALAAMDAQGEAVAWMRDSGVPANEEAWCITDSVKRILQAATPDKVERYTIPLYTRPLPQGGEVVAWEFIYCNQTRMVWFEKPPYGGHMDKVFSRVRPLIYGDSTPPARTVPEPCPYVVSGREGTHYCRLNGPVPEGRGAVLDEVAAERRRQDEKWGGPANDDAKPEERWCQHIQDYAGWARVMVGMNSPEKYRRRMVNIAALAVAAIEALDRLTAAQPAKEPTDGR